jgi:hypothetical protein
MKSIVTLVFTSTFAVLFVYVAKELCIKLKMDRQPCKTPILDWVIFILGLVPEIIQIVQRINSLRTV